MQATGHQSERVLIEILSIAIRKTVNYCISHCYAHVPIAKLLLQTAYRGGREWNFTLCANPNHGLF